MNRLRGRWLGGRYCGLSGLALVWTVGCSTSADKENAVTTHQALSGSPPIALSFALPAAASLDHVVVGAATSLGLADRARVFGDAVTDAGPADVGIDAKVGNLFIGGTATLRDRAHVFGSVAAEHVSESPSATVTGATASEPTPPATINVSWTVTVNGAAQGDVNLEPNLSRDLAPGKYGHFSVKSGSTVSLHSGVYELADFLLEPQARLIVDDSQGPVQVVVDHDFTFRGAVVAGHQPVAQILFAVQGNSALVESPFVGALVAPHASVHFQAALPQGHRAFVFGSSVTLEPDTKIESFPFDWTAVSADFTPQPSERCFLPVAQSQACPVRGSRTGLVLPSDISPEDVAVAASGVLTLGSAAQADAALVNVGNWETTLNTSALSGGIWSEASTSLSNAAHVSGNVLSHSTVFVAPEAQVTGTIKQNTPLSPTVPILWLALFPTANDGPVSVAPDATVTLPPGDYGTVTVGARATLTLTGGTYSFDSLSSNVGSVILAESKDTPLIVHVRNGFTLSGRVARSPDANQGALFTYFGKNALSLTQPFQATLAAPFASLELVANAQPYRGAFFANNVTVDTGAVVIHEAFGSWAALPAIEQARRGPLPTIQTRTSNGAPPVLDATAASATRFVDWLVQSSKADLPAARSALQQVRDKDSVVANLTQQFSAVRASDATRATLILNAIGSLRTAGGEALFTSLLNEPLPIPVDTSLEAAQTLRLLERYQTAAVHGLAFMHSSTGDALLKSLMTNHPSVQIRSQAVRSFLFHNPDTDRAALAAQLNPGEAYFADRFENRNADSSSSFDDRLSAYLAKHPQ